MEHEAHVCCKTMHSGRLAQIACSGRTGIQRDEGMIALLKAEQHTVNPDAGLMSVACLRARQVRRHPCSSAAPRLMLHDAAAVSACWQMAAAQPGKGAARMQRVPFVPDLFEPALKSSSVEELEGMLAQLNARGQELAGEMEVARRLEEDIPGGSLLHFPAMSALRSVEECRTMWACDAFESAHWEMSKGSAKLSVSCT